MLAKGSEPDPLCYKDGRWRAANLRFLTSSDLGIELLPSNKLYNSLRAVRLPLRWTWLAIGASNRTATSALADKIADYSR